MSRQRILVVDDDESLRWVTEVQLQQAGYHAVSAASGEEALAALRENPAELVITDHEDARHVRDGPAAQIRAGVSPRPSS